MADLHTLVGGLDLATPVIAAAGPLTETGQSMAACATAGAAAVVARTASVHPAPVVMQPSFMPAAGMRGAALNTELWSPRAAKLMIADYARARTTGAPLIISLGHTAEDIRLLAPLVRPFADAIELSTHFLADDPRLMAEAVSSAKAALTVPVWVKLTALGRDAVAWARVAQEAGADAVVATGAFGPCLAVDAEKGQLAFRETGGYAWLTGAAIKNISLRCVWDIARAVEVPVIGCGGIARGADAVEYLMAGASAVQVCTAAVMGGPSVFGKITQELNAWLDDHGRASVNEIRGEAQRQMQGRVLRTDHVAPLLDLDLCIGCEICPTSCVYGALEMTGERKTAGYKVTLKEDRCWGCGICATRCPTRALRMQGVSLVS